MVGARGGTNTTTPTGSAIDYRRRRNYGIRGRTTGSAGHVVTNLEHPGLPRDIRLAVEGQRNGWQRLQRFQQMMTYPSMNSAAQAMGLHLQNRNLQIQRLEADIGTPILQRAPHRYTPMVPTRRGQLLLGHLTQSAIRDLLDRYADANTEFGADQTGHGADRSGTDKPTHCSFSLEQLIRRGSSSSAVAIATASAGGMAIDQAWRV